MPDIIQLESNAYCVGDTWIPKLEIFDENDQAIDVSQYSVKYGIKRSKSRTAEYPNSSFPISGTAANGYVTATVLPGISATITPGRYWEEFEISIGSGQSQVVQSFGRWIIVDSDAIE